MEYLAFMGAIRHEHIDYVIERLEEYPIALYIVSMETAVGVHVETEGQHMHFVVQMKENDYKAFCKVCFITHFKLRGKAKDGLPKQYGKLPKIRDIEKMKAYTCKDQNLRTNMTDEEIKHYIKLSFKKQEDKSFRDELLDYLTKQQSKRDRDFIIAPWEPGYVDPLGNMPIVSDIIQFYRNTPSKPALTRSKIESHLRYFQLHHQPQLTPNALAAQFFPMGI